ncbi:MAG: 23S rRNA (guanosine(2251)-2'-O)-methyltransferase RlmB [Betaproteobacteria bacterium]
MGRNPVLEAMRAGHPITRLLVAKGGRSGTLLAIMAGAREKGIPVQLVERERLERLAGPGHQGVVAYAAAKEYVELDDLLRRAGESGEEPLVIVVDSLEDPHNLGSILRTADAVGAHGVVIPKHRNVGLTATVAKTSAGAVEYVPVARVTNLVNALARLKEAGLWVVGADQDAEQEFTEAHLSGPLAVVVGGEGKGLSRLVRERCDFLVRLPMRGKVNSLNAGVAAAVLLYEVMRQRAGLQ